MANPDKIKRILPLASKESVAHAFKYYVNNKSIDGHFLKVLLDLIEHEGIDAEEAYEIYRYFELEKVHLTDQNKILKYDLAMAVAGSKTSADDAKSFVINYAFENNHQDLIDLVMRLDNFQADEMILMKLSAAIYFENEMLALANLKICLDRKIALDCEDLSHCKAQLKALGEKYNTRFSAEDLAVLAAL